MERIFLAPILVIQKFIMPYSVEYLLAWAGWLHDTNSSLSAVAMSVGKQD